MTRTTSDRKTPPRCISSNAAQWAILVVGLVARASAQDAPAAENIAARVGAATITVAQIEQVVSRLPGHESFGPEVITRLRAETLTELVNKALVIEHLDRQKFLPDEKPWEARWVRYVADRITDDDARKFFDEHRREFDGTQLKVCHILFKIESPQDDPATQRTLAAARQLRKRIAAGEITFAAAAREHSTGPSRDRDGDLGFIGRRAPMVESFSRAAFTLEPGQISEPAVTPFGVHLILCTEIKPGRMRWEEVNRELRAVLSARLLHQIADQMRPRVKIEFTGASPYVDPTTGAVKAR